jgi:hypothetical protein
MPPRKEQEGAGKTGCALHPRSRVPMHMQKKRTRAYRFSGSSPAFPAQWLYGLFRALPGETRLACHRRRADTSAQFDTSHWGVRTTRLCRTLQPRSSVAAFASTAPRPNVSDDGQRPLSRDGMAKIKQVICPRRKQKYFCKRGWTQHRVICPAEKFNRMTEPVSPDPSYFPSRGKSRAIAACAGPSPPSTLPPTSAARAPDNNNLRRTTAPKGEPHETRLRAANHDL